MAKTPKSIAILWAMAACGGMGSGVAGSDRVSFDGYSDDNWWDKNPDKKRELTDEDRDRIWRAEEKRAKRAEKRNQSK